jgi:hypothetical protein
LQNAQQGAGQEEGLATRQPELGYGDKTPQDHLSWNPPIRAQPLGYQLGRKLGAEEGQLEDRIAEIVIVRRKPKITQKIVSEGVGDVRSIHLKGDEHDTSPDHDPEVDNANDFALFAPCPSKRGVKVVDVFPAIMLVFPPPLSFLFFPLCA